MGSQWINVVEGEILKIFGCARFLWRFDICHAFFPPILHVKERGKFQNSAKIFDFLIFEEHTAGIEIS